MSRLNNKDELKKFLNQSITIFINPYYRLLKQYLKISSKNIPTDKNEFNDDIIKFNKFISLTLDKNRVTQDYNQQTIDIKINSKIYSKIIRLENLINDLQKLNLDKTLFNNNLINMEKDIKNILNTDTKWVYYYENDILRDFVYKKYMVDFMIGNYKKQIDNINNKELIQEDFKPKLLKQQHEHENINKRNTNNINKTNTNNNKNNNKNEFNNNNQLELDDDPNNNIFQSLWIGGTLSNMEKICIQSFLDNGHVFHLYTYGEVSGVPEGTIIKDGNEILDKSEIFTYKNGSYSAFSNLFRFALLYKKGGYWVDTDFVCLKPIKLKNKYVIPSEPNEDYSQQFITSCFLKLPKGSKEALEGITIQREHKKLILNGTITWSSGPKTVNDIVNKFNLQNYVLPWRSICSCFCHHSKTIVEPNHNINNQIINSLDNKPFEMFGIHLWNECWRRNGMDKNGTFNKESIYEQLKSNYLNNTNKNDDDNEKKNDDCNSIDKKYNIIFLVNRTTYLTKMSRVRFHGINKISEFKSVSIIYSGFGWNNYNVKISIHENLENIRKEYEWNTINLVIGYKPLEIEDYINIKYPKMIRYNEMYDIEWTLKEILESGSDYVICHHLNDYETYLKMNIMKKNSSIPVKFYYIGHCAEKSVYKPWMELQQKPYDLMLVGCLGGHYPLRNRFNKLLSIFKNKGYRVYIHPHPGYDLKDAYTDRYQIEFAQAISKTKIALTDTGLPKSRFGKYIEIPACGTLLCGDVPGDKDVDGFKADDYNFIIEVNLDMSDDDIISRIEYYLKEEHKKEYEDKITKGLEFASNYTQEKYADRLFEFICDF